jgi:hypothetical protein
MLTVNAAVLTPRGFGKRPDLFHFGIQNGQDDQLSDCIADLNVASLKGNNPHENLAAEGFVHHAAANQEGMA